jgi:hypothetical protein
MMMNVDGARAKKLGNTVHYSTDLTTINRCRSSNDDEQVR